MLSRIRIGLSFERRVCRLIGKLRTFSEALMSDFRAVTAAVVKALSRAYGESEPPLWPDLAPPPKPEVRAVFADDLSARIELVWGSHIESYQLTPQEVAVLHAGLHGMMARAYERIVSSGSGQTPVA